MIQRTLTMMAVLISSVCVAHASEDDESTGDSEIAFETEEAPQQKVTALHFISSAKDYIGQGKAIAYYDGIDGRFTISNNYHNGVSIRYQGGNWGDSWSIDFSAPEKESLEPGIYKYAQRFPFNGFKRPGFDISGSGRGCNMLDAEFEILEIKYNDDDKIESFAANFIQKCEKNGPPLFGSIRYNSTTPIETRFDEIFGDAPESVLYFFKYDPSLIKSQPILITSDEGDFCVRPLPYGGEGLEIFVDAGKQGLWALDFATPFGEKIEVGVYKPVFRYPFQRSDCPGIEISTPDGGFSQPNGEFEVLKLIKGPDGKIESLALNFVVKNRNGECLKGAIRFNSKLPVNLNKPY